MAGTVIADNLQAASTSQLVIKNGVASTPPTIQDSAGTEIGTFCRAWVNFNGTGTVAIRASFNVSSITDNGTGDYTVNFTTAMPDANYAVTHIWGNGSTRDWGGFSTVGAAATSNVKIFQTLSTGVAFDAAVINVAIFR
tara:strand:- start:3794 stop:4210 length:417 start_codon:yes stop_codon:yes gene_type:complete